MFSSDDYFIRLIDKIQWDVITRRNEDDILNNMNGISILLNSREMLNVDTVYFYAKVNAKDHRTVRCVHR